MYDGKNRLNPVQSNPTETKCSIVDVGRLSCLVSSSKIGRSPGFWERIFVIPYNINRRVPIAPNIGNTINVKAGISGIILVSA